MNIQNNLDKRWELQLWATLAEDNQNRCTRTDSSGVGNSRWYCNL